jgi:hypothetical protein
MCWAHTSPGDWGVNVIDGRTCHHSTFCIFTRTHKIRELYQPSCYGQTSWRMQHEHPHPGKLRFIPNSHLLHAFRSACSSCKSADRPRGIPSPVLKGKSIWPSCKSAALMENGSSVNDLWYYSYPLFNPGGPKLYNRRSAVLCSKWGQVRPSKIRSYAQFLDFVCQVSESIIVALHSFQKWIVAE